MSWATRAGALDGTRRRSPRRRSTRWPQEQAVKNPGEERDGEVPDPLPTSGLLSGRRTALLPQREGGITPPSIRVFRPRSQLGLVPDRGAEQGRRGTHTEAACLHRTDAHSCNTHAVTRRETEHRKKNAVSFLRVGQLGLAVHPSALSFHLCSNSCISRGIEKKGPSYNTFVQVACARR